jgi:hypothetical protein
MDSFTAFMLGEANRRKPLIVFDWDKAARLIAERRPERAAAGLRSDWEYTGGVIAVNGDPVTTEYTYLESTWAVPELDMDGDVIECWRYSTGSGWDSSTKWPDSARAILAAALKDSIARGGGK